MAEEEEEVELSEEELALLQKAYQRPALGFVLRSILGFERSREIPVEEEEAPEAGV